jgi:soluble lytic murein transglycosylase-like protein
MDSNIEQALTDAANQYGLPPALVIAQAQQESGGNPNAVSPVGAQGVMQLMPATAAQLGVTDPFDPVQNITAGVKYLAQLVQQFGGDLSLALAAYNWGPGNVSKNGYNNWPTETQNYVANILGNSGVAPVGTGSTDVSTDNTTDAGSVLPGGGDLLAILLVGGGIIWALVRAFGS